MSNVNITNTTRQNPEPQGAENVSPGVWFAPPVDIYENQDELLVVADFPGVVPTDLSISLHNDQLVVEGKRAMAVEGSAVREELEATGFRRSFIVPQGVDGDKITASLANGVLNVRLPKSEAVKPRQIQVRAG